MIISQSCAKLEYQSFLSEEKTKMVEKCVNSGRDHIACDIEATNNINSFREQIER
jgi:hypothetical protein